MRPASWGHEAGLMAHVVAPHGRRMQNERSRVTASEVFEKSQTRDARKKVSTKVKMKMFFAEHRKS